MRPMLRPGCHVLRRGPGELQVGLAPRHAVVLPDDPDTRTSLDLLATGADQRGYRDRHVLDALRAHDLLVDAGALLPLIPACSQDERDRPGLRTPSTPRHDVAAIARRAGDGATDLVTARSQVQVQPQVFADLPDGLLAAELVRGLGRAGLARTGGTAPRRRRSAAARPVRTLAVLAGVGEPQRELTDGWIRAGTPHLLVRLTEGTATVGPFVVPGQTACLRCLDAHHADADPAWPLLVRQYATASSTDRADGVPEPVDSLLATLVLSWAGRDLATYAEGGQPSTWSTTITVDAQLTSLEARSWLRHPGCGCGWA